ncbi:MULTISPECIES: hypothetical protein [unclassified Cyanobium]|uniref:hypothetical protein n=1 Tax=unclassified Cyanobium TaxID=2627006 RepID=UPI0020CBE3A8|nr:MULTISPECIES: hypothetical protein [unclassified Cyanobium]MCP9776617.1 hypothetical protein [Cyanobium sp. Tous-M-B4]MCP9877085.1 hypothetical protein [Cyanobium sp. A2C-AMD]
MPESWKDLDRLVSAGRQLVDGVSGARPGSRSGNRGEGRRLDGLGRWVENKLDWILEDEDDWREPWQETRPELGSQDRPRRRLDAISRRSAAPPQGQPRQAREQEEWPEDDAFVLPRWQRQPPSAPQTQPPAQSQLTGRAMPRSSRRRAGG